MPDQHINGFYVALPETTLFSEQWKNLMPSTRCIFMAMLGKYWRKGDEANGKVRWKQEELVDKTGLSLNTIKRGLNELKEKEWLIVWEPGGRWLDGTTYEVNPIWANGKE